MSLINEALRRTRDQSFRGSPPTHAAAPSYRLEQSLPIRSRRFSWLVISSASAFTVVALAVLLVQLRGVPANPPAPLAVPPVVVPAPAEVVVDSELAARLTEQMALTAAAKVAPVPPTPEPDPPQFTLQGITREGRNFEAMINGRTVRVGDEVDGARVIAIERRLVRLQHGRHTVTLPWL